MNNNDAKLKLALEALDKVSKLTNAEGFKLLSLANYAILDVLEHPVLEPIPDRIIEQLFDRLAKDERAVKFGAMSWFVSGFTMAEAAHEIRKQI